MTDIATAPRMDPEMQTDMSSPSTNTPDMSIEERLLEQVTCNICTEVLYNPVTLHFCGHVFCGGCVEPWLASNITCPICRAGVRRVTDDFRARNLVELYLHLNPSKIRSDEEMEKLRWQHKRGEKLEIGVRETDEDEDEDDEYHGEILDDDDSDEEDEGPETTWAYQPCRWCDPDNGGFVCSLQLVAAGFNTIPDEHLCCRYCGGLFPDRGRPEQECTSCGVSSCHYMNPTCTASQLKPFAAPLYTDADERRDSEIINVRAFHSNETEYMRFMRYKWDNNLELEDLKVMMAQDYRDHPDQMTLGFDRYFTPDSLICEHCRKSIFTTYILDWWTVQVNELGVVPDERPKCRYGRECRTQHSELRHRERLNHLGRIIPEQEGI